MAKQTRSNRRQYATVPVHQTSSAYAPGDICWLKPQEDFEDDGTVPELPKKCYDHPAVILWTIGTEAAIFIITSFHETPLHIKHANNQAVRAQHIPIAPSPKHPDTGQLLNIVGDSLTKDSYVKIQHVRVCSTRALRPHGGRRLTKASRKLLLKYAPAKPAAPTPRVSQSDLLASQEHKSDAGPSTIRTVPLIPDRLPTHYSPHTSLDENRPQSKLAHASRKVPASTLSTEAQSDTVTSIRTGHTYGTTRSYGYTSYTYDSQPTTSEGGGSSLKVWFAAVALTVVGYFTVRYYRLIGRL